MESRSVRNSVVTITAALCALALAPASSGAMPTYTADPDESERPVDYGEQGVAVSATRMLSVATCPLKVSDDRGWSWRDGPATTCPAMGGVWDVGFDPSSGGVVARGVAGIARYGADGSLVEWLPGEDQAQAVVGDSRHVYALGYDSRIVRRWEGGAWQACASTAADPLVDADAVTYPRSNTPQVPTMWSTSGGHVVVRYESAVAIFTDRCTSVRVVATGDCHPATSAGPAHVLVGCPSGPGGKFEAHLLQLANPDAPLVRAPAALASIDPNDLIQTGNLALDDAGLVTVMDMPSTPGWSSTWGDPTRPAGDAPSSPLQTRALAQVNAVRRPMGLSPIGFSARVQEAARRHAMHYELVGEFTAHGEYIGKPGFSGSGPEFRCWRTGTDNCWEVAFEEVKVSAAIDGWLRTPFHGLPLLQREAAGFGQSRGGSVAKLRSSDNASAWWTHFSPGTRFDPSRPASTPTSTIRSYPYPGQRDMNTNWLGSESPHPLRRYKGNHKDVAAVMFAMLGEPATVELVGPGGKLVPLLLPDGTTSSPRLQLAPGPNSFFAAAHMRVAWNYALRYRTADGRVYRVPFRTAGIDRSYNPRRGCRAVIKRVRRAHSLRVTIRPVGCPPAKGKGTLRTKVQFKVTEGWRDAWPTSDVVSYGYDVQWRVLVGRRSVAQGVAYWR